LNPSLLLPEEYERYDAGGTGIKKQGTSSDPHAAFSQVEDVPHLGGGLHVSHLAECCSLTEPHPHSEERARLRALQAKMIFSPTRPG